MSRYDDSSITVIKPKKIFLIPEELLHFSKHHDPSFKYTTIIITL